MINSASVAIALVLSLAGPSPFETGALSGSTAAAPLRLAAGKLWAPKKSKPKSDDDDDTSQKEEELLKPQKTKAAPQRSAPAQRPAPRPATGTTTRARHRIKMDDSAGEEEDDTDSEGDDEEEDRPKITKRRKRVAEEEEEDDDDEDEEILPLPSVAVVLPRLVGLEVGTAVMDRRFHFNTPGQVDNHVRFGYQFALEAFPLLRVPSNFWRRLGLGAYYEAESGDASVVRPDGTTSSLSASMTRWGFDARYVITPHARVTLVPAVGYGSSAAKVDIPSSLMMMTMGLPSNCTTDVSFPCMATANPYYMTIDLHVRFAATPELGLELAGGYMLGVGITHGPGQISTSEATASMQGYHVDIGANMLVYRDWLALSAQIPIRYHGYSFSVPAGSAAAYRSASDTSYGVLLGLAALGP